MKIFYTFFSAKAVFSLHEQAFKILSLHNFLQVESVENVTEIYKIKRWCLIFYYFLPWLVNLQFFVDWKGILSCGQIKKALSGQMKSIEIGNNKNRAKWSRAKSWGMNEMKHYQQLAWNEWTFFGGNTIFVAKRVRIIFAYFSSGDSGFLPWKYYKKAFFNIGSRRINKPSKQ